MDALPDLSKYKDDNRRAGSGDLTGVLPVAPCFYESGTQVFYRASLARAVSRLEGIRETFGQILYYAIPFDEWQEHCESDLEYYEQAVVPTGKVVEAIDEVLPRLEELLSKAAVSKELFNELVITIRSIVKEGLDTLKLIHDGAARLFGNWPGLDALSQSMFTVAVINTPDERSRVRPAMNTFEQSLVSAGDHRFSVAQKELLDLEADLRLEPEILSLNSEVLRAALEHNPRPCVRFSESDPLMEVSPASLQVLIDEVLSEYSQLLDKLRKDAFRRIAGEDSVQFGDPEYWEKRGKKLFEWTLNAETATVCIQPNGLRCELLIPRELHDELEKALPDFAGRLERVHRLCEEVLGWRLYIQEDNEKISSDGSMVIVEMQGAAIAASRSNTYAKCHERLTGGRPLNSHNQPERRGNGEIYLPFLMVCKDGSARDIMVRTEQRWIMTPGSRSCLQAAIKQALPLLECSPKLNTFWIQSRGGYEERDLMIGFAWCELRSTQHTVEEERDLRSRKPRLTQGYFAPEDPVSDWDPKISPMPTEFLLDPEVFRNISYLLRRCKSLEGSFYNESERESKAFVAALVKAVGKEYPRLLLHAGRKVLTSGNLTSVREQLQTPPVESIVAGYIHGDRYYEPNYSFSVTMTTPEKVREGEFYRNAKEISWQTYSRTGSKNVSAESQE